MPTFNASAVDVQDLGRWFEVPDLLRSILRDGLSARAVPLLPKSLACREPGAASWTDPPSRVRSSRPWRPQSARPDTSSARCDSKRVTTARGQGDRSSRHPEPACVRRRQDRRPPKQALTRPSRDRYVAGRGVSRNPANSGDSTSRELSVLLPPDLRSRLRKPTDAASSRFSGRGTAAARESRATRGRSDPGPKEERGHEEKRSPRRADNSIPHPEL